MKKIFTFVFLFISVMTLFGCNETHEHTYGDYIAYESGHCHQYTCGCPQPEILEGHIDADENGSCDKCGYTIEEYHTEHTWTCTPAGAVGHYTTYTCGCPSEEGTTQHYDEDEDNKCDACEYPLIMFDIEWLYSDTHHWYLPEGEEVFGIVYGYGEHIDDDNNNRCDICDYLMISPDEIPTTYIVSHISNGVDYVVPSAISLDKKDNTFTYFFSAISSYIGQGTFEYKDGLLILESNVDEQTWVFKVVDKALVYDWSLSDGHLWFINVPENTNLTYFLLDTTEEEKIRTMVKINNELRPMGPNDKVYTSFEKEFGLATAFLLSKDAEVVWSETVAGVKFTYYDSGQMYIYYNGLIYTLSEAYENGVLTVEDLVDIAKVYSENCKLGHSWDKGYFDYKVPTGEKYFVQTCLVCGETKSELVEDVVDDLTVTDIIFHYVETGYCDIETSYNLIYSKNDLTRYYEKNKDNYNLENNIYATRFLEVCDSYTSQFFEDNVLILIPTTVGNTRDELFVLSYQVDGEYFIINIETVCPESEADGADVIVGCHLFVEVKEEHLEKAQYIKIIKDGVWDNEPPQERKFSDWYSFLKVVNVEEIKEVQWVDYRGSIAPGVLQETKFSTNSNDISNIFNYFKNLNLSLTDPNKIDQIKPGYAPKYYSFVTEDEIYYIYLHSYLNKNSAIYTVDFNVPEMANTVVANNILDHFSKHNVYFTTKVEPWVLDEITYLGDLMIKEYDNGNKYHMSDELYIDFDGVKIRIIDETHFEYNQKYYEIIGTVSFSEVFEKMAAISARKNNYTVTINYSLLEEFDSIKDAKYMHGQALNDVEIKSILNDEKPDAYRTWYLYLDEECTIPFEDTFVTGDITIYATNKSPEGNIDYIA